MKIIDAFIFYNEVDMLRYRLNVLKDIVDKFVIVESNFTFAGNAKELYFDKNLLNEFNIVYVLVDLPFLNPTKEEVWKNEKFQRNCIDRGLTDLQLDDYIIISDVDEIPDTDTLKKIKIENKITVGQFEQDFYYYNRNSLLDHRWYYSKIVKYSWYCSARLSCDEIRNRCYETIEHGGWHLSYFGNSEFIANKIKNFSHQEYNDPEYTNQSLITERINNKQDLFKRNITILPPNLNYPPPFKGNTLCFIDCFTLTNCGSKTLEYLLERLKKFPIDQIFINNIGIPINLIGNVVNYSTDTQLFEPVTINLVREFSIKNPGNKILYLHTKGISLSNDNIDDWVNMMLYFLLQKSNISLNYDTIGCNYHDGSQGIPKHYSGNFWWASTDYLAKLPECGPGKWDAETWLMSNNPRYLSLHNSGINHYKHPYPCKNYDYISQIASNWAEHRDFAEWLVDLIKPKVIVELGVDGYSSFVFANANKYGKIYIFTEDRQYSFIKDTIKERGIDNLEIIKDDFVEVLKTWNQPINILHIDKNKYEDVKKSFELANFAEIVLFHGTNSNGTKDFFKEIDDFKLEFKHSSGLGIYTKNEELYQKILKTFDNVCGTKIFGFHASGHLCERGTTIAMFDYAYFNQKYNKNKSIIFYEKDHPFNNDKVIEKFKKEFEVYCYTSFSEIENFNLDYFYNIKGNNDKNQLTKFKNLSHIVFEIKDIQPNKNENVFVISNELSNKYNCVPHMINLPNHSENMKILLGIPSDAIVIGRHGGKDTFDITYVHEVIRCLVNEVNDIYFIFVNTQPFYNHPNIIYLDCIIDLYEKVKFINTCDAMLHARMDGETFGLAIGEFSTLNKPIITSYGKHNNHIKILGNRALVYNSKESLKNILLNVKNLPKIDWNAYREYSPEKVMKKFYSAIDKKQVVIYAHTDNTVKDHVIQSLVSFSGYDILFYSNVENIEKTVEQLSQIGIPLTFYPCKKSIKDMWLDGIERVNSNINSILLISF